MFLGPIRLHFLPEIAAPPAAWLAASVAEANSRWNTHVYAMQSGWKEAVQLIRDESISSGLSSEEDRLEVVFPTCASQPLTVPFSCDSYMAAFCRLYTNRVHRSYASTSPRNSLCSAPALHHMMCDDAVLTQCGSFSLATCFQTSDTSSYQDTVQWLKESVAECSSGNASSDVCAAPRASCADLLPVRAPSALANAPASVAVSGLTAGASSSFRAQ
ncbi:hypothetical protein CYMTET_31277 [Cymbomonas tetramitiformis]|uniref:Uncharacterized protein n=1 Tax=Cymbomonas tetramitiformis TaxID=36881 RepID=A0AAE0FHS0_9CHLO|nr:hypothetical protein CYMTET_31277 [Cymbomonas tetramitiformis]